MNPSTSFDNTQNCSEMNVCNFNLKKELHRISSALTELMQEKVVDNDKRVDITKELVQETEALASAGTGDPSVALSGSYVLQKAGQVALAAVSDIEVNVNLYNAMELALHIKSNSEWWQFALPRRVASAGALHGTYERPPPARARAPRRRPAPRLAAGPRQPDRVASLETANEVQVMVSRVRSCVKRACRRGPLCYWRAVLDPGSFARSVENVYYVSFLVRDGLLDVYIDKDYGVPMLRSIARAHRPERDISEENQFVVSLDMPLWRTLIDTCGITEPMMTLQ